LDSDISRALRAWMANQRASARQIETAKATLSFQERLR